MFTYRKPTHVRNYVRDKAIRAILLNIQWENWWICASEVDETFYKTWGRQYPWDYETHPILSHVVLSSAHQRWLRDIKGVCMPWLHSIAGHWKDSVGFAGMQLHIAPPHRLRLCAAKLELNPFHYALLRTISAAVECLASQLHFNCNIVLFI